MTQRDLSINSADERFLLLICIGDFTVITNNKNSGLSCPYYLPSNLMANPAGIRCHHSTLLILHDFKRRSINSKLYLT